MFEFLRKKTQVEQLIAKDGIEHATERFAEVISRKLPTKEIAYQFILEELDGASRGNAASERFAQSSGIPPEEYKGALSNSNPDVDGPEGPQQLMLALSLELVKNQALMAEFRCKVDDKVMKRFSLGKYAQAVVTTQTQETRVVDKSQKKTGKDQYLENVASILHSTLGPMMPIQNAYDLAAECLGELKGNISKGMFRDGANPREAVMAYYTLCSMVSESSSNDDKEEVFKISIMALVLADQFKDQSNLTPLEKGICLFGEQALSEGLPKHTEEDVAQIKLSAAEIIFKLVSEQGAEVSRDDLLKLVKNVSANMGNGDRYTYKVGDKVLAISTLSNVTGYSIDQGDIKMANVYASCLGAAFNKYVKGQKESFNDYQNDALKEIINRHIPVVKELMQCNEGIIKRHNE